MTIYEMANSDDWPEYLDVTAVNFPDSAFLASSFSVREARDWAFLESEKLDKYWLIFKVGWYEKAK